jgi:hypothetical protein
MQPYAFVVMPFGQKPAGATSGRPIDFHLVYRNPIEPALRQAGYEVVRSDSEVAAGDIRTDMCFELVTADLVVADISILNVNVFLQAWRPARRLPTGGVPGQRQRAAAPPLRRRCASACSSGPAIPQTPHSGPRRASLPTASTAWPRPPRRCSHTNGA